MVYQRNFNKILKNKTTYTQWRNQGTKFLFGGQFTQEKLQSVWAYVSFILGGNGISNFKCITLVWFIGGLLDLHNL